jgi:amidase
MNLDLIGLDATAQAELVRTRAISASELVEATLQRIDELSRSVNAFRVVLTDDARRHAERIDTLSAASLAELPMAGVPVAIKDDTDVVGERTAWGSTADRGRAERDAEVVRRLRAAGATIIGKTNVPELTLWPWTASKAFGVTRNPWDLERTPGGSSGGSAVAVCAGMAAVALGSDGGGSIRYPAGLTGLIGLKPQRGRIPIGSEHGSAWHGLVVLGPLTRSARDAALFLDVTASDVPTTTFRDAMSAQVRPLRIGVSTNAPPGSLATLSKTGRGAVETATALLTDLGHDVREVEIDYGLASLWNSTVRLLKGVQHDVGAFDSHAVLEARTRTVARFGRALSGRALTRAVARETQLAERINRVLDDVDVVLTPLSPQPAPQIDECPRNGALRSLRASNTSAWLVPWNVTGQPAITVPIGLEHDMPTAIQLVARPDGESILLDLANQIEQARAFPRWSIERST